MSGPLDGVSPVALDLARRLGLDPLRTFGPRTDYWGSDQRLQTNPRSAIEASLNFEQTSGGNRGATGGCGQDPSKVPGR